MKEELLKKCENLDDPNVMSSCRMLLDLIKKKNVKIGDDEQTYMEMAENLKPSHLPRVLELALRIRESGDIKDTEVKNAASRLIRAIEMS